MTIIIADKKDVAADNHQETARDKQTTLRQPSPQQLKRTTGSHIATLHAVSVIQITHKYA